MESKIILITGASTGVGLATAKILSCDSPDYHVILTARSIEKAEQAKQQIEAESPKGKITPLQLDVTDEDSIQRAVDFVNKEFGRLDVLINNAALGAKTDQGAKARFNQTFETNVTGPYLMSLAFRPLLLKSNNAYSIYVSSGVGSMAKASDPSSPTYGRNPPNVSHPSAYRGSKAALNMVALQEYIDVTQNKIPLKVFAFCPGFVRSNLRGLSQEAITGYGHAGDPEDSARGILKMIQGERDADVGTLVHKDGVYPW